MPYSRRLFLWLLGYSLLLIGAFVAFQYHREKEFKAGEINAQLQLINSYILTELSEGVKPRDIRLDEFHPFDDLRVSIIAADGKVLYDNSLDSLPSSNHLDRSEIQQAMRHGSGFAQRRHSSSTGTTYFYSARRSPDGCIVRTAVPYTLSFDDLLRADYGFLWVMGLIALAMCTLGCFATRRVGEHISRLNRFATSVENGEQIHGIEPFPRDELGQISSNIIRIYARLQQANAERDARHREALHQQQEKERIKKQLTNNINHELKTPVAAVRVCVETMLEHPDMDAARRRDFLMRCLSGTDRLQRLLADVSLITRMDDGCDSIVRSAVNLTDIIRSTVDEHRPVADARGLVIDCRLGAPLTVVGNASLLEAVFNNLIDNAISYSGGDRITIWLISAAEGRIVLGFSDNGHGVEAEHLPRLFERFYRIDKGRSRAAGGTGLGLSIVKNALLIHGGSITVANSSGDGLRFRIVIPGREGDFTKN